MDFSMLITGGNGFLGQHIGDFFHKNGFQIMSLGRTSLSEIICDLSVNVPNIPKIDFVIHAAGKAHVVPKTIDEENDFFNVNYKGTINLCKGLENSGDLPKQFIFISSVAVYGVDEGENIDESHPLNGESPYAKSKIKAENYLLHWAKKNNVVLTILRLPLIAGPNPPGNLGAMINGMKSGKYASIGKANAKKSVIWVEDIPKFILEVKGIGGIYNLTDNYHPTFRELELHISRKFNKSKPFSVPLLIARSIALIGDLIGDKFPINSEKLKKITSTLTFKSEKAMNIPNWKPNQVLDKF
jgi:nucleoside-diphosphate-sugar epimerase